MKSLLRPGNLLTASLAVIGLAACGGGDTFPPATVGNESATSPAAPQASQCGGPADYTLFVFWDAPPSETPRDAGASVRTCLGTPVAGVAVDWAVTAGGGTVDDQATKRTITDADGFTTVAWKYGPPGTQTVEAQLTQPAVNGYGALTYTLLPLGANTCAASGGTNLGENRTVSADETWTRAGSPFYTQCSTSTCTGQIAVIGSAVLTLEPGVRVCVNQVLVAGSARLVAAGTASELVTFGVRDRGDHWKGIEFQPTDTPSIPSPSVLRHVAIENADSLRVTAHPINIEDTIVRRVAPGNRPERCTNFEISQHAVATIAPSRVNRTVIDGLGARPTPWEFDDSSCPAVRINLTAETPPLTMSARILNSRSNGVEIVGHSTGSDVDRTRLTNCEISGSADSGLAAYWFLYALPRIESCNIFGNAGAGVATEQLNLPGGPLRLSAQNNWWGDPVGPEGSKGDGTFGYVDASLPLAEPVKLDY
jgi:hypothetical protein